MGLRIIMEAKLAVFLVPSMLIITAIENIAFSAHFKT